MQPQRTQIPHQPGRPRSSTRASATEPMPAAVKDPAVRAQEARLISAQLEDIGLPREDIEDVHRSLEAFVADGTGVTRSYKVPVFGVSVSLLLSTQAHIVSYAKVSRLS